MYTVTKQILVYRGWYGTGCLICMLFRKILVVSNKNEIPLTKSITCVTKFNMQSNVTLVVVPLNPKFE